MNWIFIIVLIVLLKSNAISTIVDGPIKAVESLMPTSQADLFNAHIKLADEALNTAHDYPAAERSCDQALAINPQSARAYHKRAVSRGSACNWQGALEDMDRAISISPAFAPFYEYRATANEKLGHGQQAAADRATAQALHQTTRPAGK
jgi:tetratricopeptide (TPR) repeat protein